MAHVQRKCLGCRRSVRDGARRCPSCGERRVSYVARYIGPDRKERTRSFPRKIDAEAFLNDTESSKLHGTWIDPALGRRSFGAWAEQWFGLQVALKPKTIEGYRGILDRHLIPRFGSWSLVEIQPVDVRQFVADLRAAEMAPRTVRNIYRVLSGILRAAVANRLIASSPCIGVELPRPQRREMLVLTSRQVAQLAEATDPETGLLLTFAAYSGLRWGEIAALRVGRFNPLPATVDVIESATEVGGEVRFVAPKNGRTRTVRLPRALVEQLVQLVAGKAPEDFVFARPNGAVLRHSRFYWRVFRPAVAAAGLPAGLRFHDLRHTCAALLIAQGAHPRAIMERLGHSSITITLDTYGHLLPGLDEALAEGLDATLRAAETGRIRDGRGAISALRREMGLLPAASLEAGSGIEPLCEVLQTSA